MTDWEELEFTCPRCGMTSYHPEDIREGYCGHCHNWTRPDVVISCPCGCGRVYTDPGIEAEVMRFVGELGECVKLSTPAGSWLVPRHYIALHGIKADELPTLAATHGWEKE